VDASAPIEKADKTGKFQKNHQSFLKRSKAGPIGLLFLGDSITEGWHYRAQSLFEQTYGAYQPANFGIGGDTTQNVIWRITHGELDGIHPKVVVLMIGTNNTTTHTTAQIAAADTKIVRLIREKIPGVKILLLAILPRGPRPTPAETNKTDNWQHRMEVINAVNLALAALDDGVTVRYLDIGARFLGPDGRIPGTLMSDQLHPTTAGYQIWANAMQPTLLEMLNSR
jgi:lysophospholipase L1-like esterase